MYDTTISPSVADLPAGATTIEQLIETLQRIQAQHPNVIVFTNQLGGDATEFHPVDLENMRVEEGCHVYENYGRIWCDETNEDDQKEPPSQYHTTVLFLRARED